VAKRCRRGARQTIDYAESSGSANPTPPAMMADPARIVAPEDDVAVVRVEPADRRGDVDDEHRNEQAQDREREHHEPGDQCTGE